MIIPGCQTQGNLNSFYSSVSVWLWDIWHSPLRHAWNLPLPGVKMNMHC